MIPKLLQNDPNMIPKCSQNDPKMIVIIMIMIMIRILILIMIMIMIMIMIVKLTQTGRPARPAGRPASDENPYKRPQNEGFRPWDLHFRKEREKLRPGL